MLIEGFCRDLPGRVEVSRGRTFVSSGVIGGCPMCLVWYIRGMS
jgi:hypothetical protein